MARLCPGQSVMLVVLALTLACTSCKRSLLTPAQYKLADLNVETPAFHPIQEKIWTKFDPDRTLAIAKRITDLGPRPSGTEANRSARNLISAEVSQWGWEIREQRFSERSPENKIVDFCNLVAHFSKGPIAEKRLLVGTHFDSLRTQIYLDRGATASAAATAILIELARVLAVDPVLASQVELVFFDGAYPFRQVTSIDGFFGSRFYAEMLSVNRSVDQISAAVILENVGSGDFALNVTRGSDPGLVSKFQKAASSLDLSLKTAGRWIITNQDPFVEKGVPAITLLDADSPILNTADDVAERLSADSLAKAGTLIVYFISSDLAFSNQ